MNNGQFSEQFLDTWALFRRAANAMLKAREKELHQAGIRSIHAAVLRSIKAYGEPMTPAELSRWLFRESQTVAGLLNRMEEKGLVRRVKVDKDRRLTKVAITKKGEDVFDKISNSEVIFRIMSTLSEGELKQFRNYVARIMSKSMEEIDEMKD